MGRTPAVFVSSTCYDLSQVRSDLKDFLVLEEASSFFAGQKTSEEVVKLIQNRAQTLVNERQ